VPNGKRINGEPRLSYLKIIFTFVAITAAIIAIAVLYSSNAFSGLYEVDITPVINWATFAANIATVAALAFLGFEIRNSTRSRHLEGAMRLFDLFDTKEARQARREVYNAYIDKREFNKNELKHVEKIRADLNQVAAMVREGLLPEKIALRMYSAVAINCWEALKEHIEKQRKLRGTPSWMDDFEWFYDESKRFRKMKYPREKLQLFKQD